MDSLWRDATTDGWELLSGQKMLASHAAGSPLRGREPDELQPNDEVLLLTRIVQPGDTEAIEDSVWVRVTAPWEQGFIGTVVKEPNAHAPTLITGQEVRFLAEHVASVRVLAIG